MKRKVSELRFDLESVRQVKRQLKRTLRYVVAMEKGMLKFKKTENERTAESKRRKKEPAPDNRGPAELEALLNAPFRTT
jgi:hypothetical protein